MQVRSLALLSSLRIWHCCELWCRMTWILCCYGCGVGRAAAALIRPLVWEPPYAVGVAQKSKKKKKRFDKSYKALGTKPVFTSLECRPWVDMGTRTSMVTQMFSTPDLTSFLAPTPTTPACFLPLSVASSSATSADSKHPGPQQRPAARPGQSSTLSG